MNNIPYTFFGKKDENINHFIYKLLNYCKNNEISTDIIVKLLLNGTLLKADAFSYIELEKDAIGKLDELEDDERLEGILALLKERYRCENFIMKIKAAIKALKQTPNELIKDYLNKSDKLFDRLDLEINISKALGEVYKCIDENEKADYVIAGMISKVRDNVLDKAVDDYGTARITYIQLKKILTKIEKKELYIKSLGDSIKLNDINCVNNRYPSPSKDQLKDENKSLRAEINFIKLGNKRLYNRTPNGPNDNNNNFGNNNYRRITFDEKKANGPCSYKRKCKFGLRCRYLHEKEDRDYFYNNYIGRGRGRGGYNNNGGRGGLGGRGGFAGGRGGHGGRTINVVQEKVNENLDAGKNNKINIATVGSDSDF